MERRLTDSTQTWKCNLVKPGQMDLTISVYSLLLLTVLCSTASQLCQKQAARVAIDTDGSVLNSWFLAGAALLGGGLLLWLMVLSRMEVSIAYPALSLNYVLVLLAARWLFGESIQLHRWIGSLSIIAGIAIMLGASGS